MNALFVATALSVFAGTGTAQLPTAPAPRELTIPGLTFTYCELEDTKSPKIEMSVKDGSIEVRWTMQNVSCSALASQAVVQNGVLTVIGTKKVPAVVTCGPSSTQRGERISIVLADGTMTVIGAP